MESSVNPPKVFISYSWESREHKAWVRHLAEKLRHFGVDARLDQWYVQPANSFTEFMEKEVIASDFVIIVCTETYANKSNARKGGVGYEQQIVSGQLMAGIPRSRFIPIIRSGEFELASNCAIPTHFLGISSLDFRSDSHFSERVNDLLRVIFAKPEFAPPPIGTPPNLHTTINSERIFLNTINETTVISKENVKPLTTVSVQEARRIISEAPDEHIKELKELLSAYELYEAPGNLTDPKAVLKFVRRAFNKPIIITQQRFDQMISDATHASESYVKTNTWNDDYNIVRETLEPILFVLPSKAECIDRILGYPDQLVIPFLIKEYFSPDKLRHESIVLDLIEAGGFGRQTLAVLEHAIQQWWPQHVIFKQVVRITKKDIGKNFEDWYRKNRGMSSEEEILKIKNEEDNKLKSHEEDAKKEIKKFEPDPSLPKPKTTYKQFLFFQGKVSEYLQSLSQIQEDFDNNYQQVEPLCERAKTIFKQHFPEFSYNVHKSQKTYSSVSDIARRFQVELELIQDQIEMHISLEKIQNDSEKRNYFQIVWKAIRSVFVD